MHLRDLRSLQIELEFKVIASGSLRKAAKKMNITAGHLSRVIKGHKMPGPKVLEYLELKEVRFYVDNTCEVE